jgi:hypothetical protein
VSFWLTHVPAQVALVMAMDGCKCDFTIIKNDD